MSRYAVYQPGEVVELLGRAKAFGTTGVIVRAGRDGAWIVQVTDRLKRAHTLSIVGRDLRKHPAVQQKENTQ